MWSSSITAPIIPSASSTLNATDEALTLDVTGLGALGVQILGTFTATLAFECSLDGVTWRPLNLTPTNATTAVSQATAAGLWIGPVAGLRKVRVRCSAYTSGDATTTMQAAPASLGGGGGGGGGGGDVAIIDGANPGIKATVTALLNSNPLATQIVDGAGTAITSFGGGTQYATGAAVATPTGTVALGWDGANVRAAKAAADGALQVDVESLPATAATAANQATGNTSLASIDTKTVQDQSLDYDTGAGTVAQKTMGVVLPASGGPVALVGNAGQVGTGTARVVHGGATTATLSNTAANTASVSVLAANASRLGATLYNDADTDCYVKCGTAASSTSFTKKLAPGEYWDVPHPYTGVLHALWDTGVTGAMRATELTA